MSRSNGRHNNGRHNGGRQDGGRQDGNPHLFSRERSEKDAKHLRVIAMDMAKDLVEYLELLTNGENEEGTWIRDKYLAPNEGKSHFRTQTMEDLDRIMVIRNTADAQEMGFNSDKYYRGGIVPWTVETGVPEITCEVAANAIGPYRRGRRPSDIATGNAPSTPGAATPASGGGGSGPSFGSSPSFSNGGFTTPGRRGSVNSQLSPLAHPFNFPGHVGAPHHPGNGAGFSVTIEATVATSVSYEKVMLDVNKSADTQLADIQAYAAWKASGEPGSANINVATFLNMNHFIRGITN